MKFLGSGTEIFLSSDPVYLEGSYNPSVILNTQGVDVKLLNLTFIFLYWLFGAFFPNIILPYGNFALLRSLKPILVGSELLSIRFLGKPLRPAH